MKRKRIIKLTEQDLKNIVKRVIKEKNLSEQWKPIRDGSWKTRSAKLGNKESIAELERDVKRGLVLIESDNAEVVKERLNNLPENLYILTIKYCEFADFSSVDLCQFKKLNYVNLTETPNNLKENINCEYKEASGYIGENLYSEGYLFNYVKPPSTLGYKRRKWD